MWDVEELEEDAGALARHALALGALVNLLPLHPGGAPALEPTARAEARRFAKLLRDQGVNATLRRSRGLDISAACGQLRTEVDQRRDIPPEEHAGVQQ